MRLQFVVTMLLLGAGSLLPIGSSAEPIDEKEITKLREEIRDKGWITYSSRTDNGTWDIILARPDGSNRTNLTNTPDFEEAAPRFSPDGGRMLYRRLEKGTTINHDQWGFQGELVISNSNGSNAEIFGVEADYPWATWSPDGKQIACLTKKGIQVIDLKSKEILRQIPRKGIYQQLAWSPDGNWFCGTANHGGEYWTVVRMDVKTGQVNALRSFQTCTPDWFPDSSHVILSTRPDGQPGAAGYGYTQLWEVNSDGTNQKLVYGEDGLHMYGGALSPDGQYALFSKCPEDGGGAEKSGGVISLMRMADAPSIGGPSPDLRKLHPEVNNGPILEIDKGWEPHWTTAEIKVRP